MTHGFQQFLRLTALGGLMSAILAPPLSAESPVTPQWGDGISGSEFAASMRKLIYAAAFNSEFKTIRAGHLLDVGKGKGPYRSFAGLRAEATNLSIPGASVCGFVPDPSARYGRGHFRCISEYASDEKAYLGWRELAKLMTDATHWAPKAFNTGGESNTELPPAELKRLLSKPGLNPHVTFTDSKAAAVIDLKLQPKLVTLEVGSENFLAAHDKVVTENLLGRLEKESDAEFGRKLLSLLKASVDDFNSIKGEYDLKQNRWPSTIQLFCGDGVGLAACWNGRTDACEIRQTPTSEVIAAHAWVSCFFTAVPYAQAIDILDSLAKKVERSTALRMNPVDPLPNSNPRNRQVSFHDPSTKGSIMVSMANDIMPNFDNFDVRVNFNGDATRYIVRSPSTASIQGNSPAPAGLRPPAESDIRREIDAIASMGQYSPLPEDHISIATAPNTATARRIIRNDTSYGLHLLMSGPVDRRIDLPPGGSTAVDFAPGSYRVAAKVDSANVRPFYGVQVLEAGIEYTSQFYIRGDR